MGVSGDHVTLPTLCHVLSTLHAHTAHSISQDTQTSFSGRENLGLPYDDYDKNKVEKIL